MFNIRSTAAKRRGAVITAAAGALALGALVPASASASSAQDIAREKTRGPIVCGVHAKPGQPGKPGEIIFSEEAKKVRQAEKARLSKVAAERGKCPQLPDLPGFPGKPGKGCTIVIVKGHAKGKKTLSFEQATPAKPGKPTKPGKPGKVCKVIVIKDGKRVVRSVPAASAESVAATAPSEAVAATRS